MPQALLSLWGKELSWKPGMVVQDSNPSTREAETSGWRVPGQPGLHSETLYQKKKKFKLDP
jgi:hypothetical protein